jgi:preprotein translocase subunit SecB
MSKQNLPVLQRVYAKDVSFEAPNVLKSVSTEWKPDMHLDLHTKVNRLEDKVFEVVLSLTALVKNSNETAYLCEVQQAGIFSVEGFDENELKKVLGCECPNILFPFAREAVSNLVTKGGFPQLLLTPIDFDTLYEKALEEQDKSGNQPH